MQRGRGVFIANPLQNAFLFFVMLQRCTSSIRGSADSVKFYIVFFFFFKLQAILYLVSVSQLLSHVAILRSEIFVDLFLCTCLLHSRTC